MNSKNLKLFVLENFELGSEFATTTAWAARLRAEFPGESDDDIMTSLCEIIDAYEPGRERGNPTVVKSYCGEDGMLDFGSPNHHALTVMDSYLQNDAALEKRWEHSVRHLYQEDDGIGWKGVQKNRPDLFKKAWNAAVEMCAASGAKWCEIAVA